MVFFAEMIYNIVMYTERILYKMKQKFTSAYKKIRDIIDEFMDGDFFGMSAEMSFYFLSSFLPMIIFVFTVASSISQNYTDTMLNVLGVLPEKAAKLLIKMLVSRTRSTTVILITGAFSLFSLSGFILTLEKAIHRFYKLKNTRGFIKSQVLALIFAFFIYIAIIASFSLIIFGKIIADTLLKFAAIPNLISIWNNLRYVVMMIFIVFVISAIFKALPVIKVRIRDMLPGAIVTTTVWFAASMLFALYVNNFPQYEIIYGSLAGFACIIMWIYITCMSMTAGAKINSMIYKRRLAKQRAGEESEAFVVTD